MSRIYLLQVFHLIGPNGIAKIHIDGVDEEINVMPSVIDTHEFYMGLYSKFGRCSIEVYQMQGLRGQYEGLEIWARFV